MSASARAVLIAAAAGVRDRWRLAVGGLLGIAVACLAVQALDKGEPALARADVLVDTPSSLIAGVTPGAATVADRAAALAAQLPRERPRRVIAETAGLAPAAVEILTADLLVPASPTPVAEAVATARSAGPVLLTAGLLDRRAPVITLTAAAGDQALTARLVRGGIAALRELAAPPPGAPPAVRIEPLGEVRVFEPKAGRSPALTAAIGSLAALGWLVALGVRAARSGSRRRSVGRPAGEAA